MRDMKKALKKYLCLITILLYCFNSMSALVSDNDGSAFVTKNEFEVLKNNFEKQIENYNKSIDNRIDGAIASYLAGIRLNKKEELRNKFEIFKLYTNQYIKDLKWNKNTNVNVNQAVAANGDTQPIYQKISWWYTAWTPNKITGKQTVNGPTESTTKEDRIEVGKNYNIIAWGEYQPWVEVVSELNYFTSCADATSIFGWAPVNYTTFGPALRKNRNAGLSYSCNASGGYYEYNYIKSYETLPTDLTSLNMNKLYIAPLSTNNEGLLPPEPLPTAPDFVRNNSGYGENVYGTASDRTLVTSLTSAYTVSNSKWYDGSGGSQANRGGMIWTNLTARWFRVCKYNELSFDTIDNIYGFTCPMKSGMPVIDKTTFSDEDKIKVIVEGAVSDGYLIPYVAKSPSDTWNGAKSIYTSGIKYKVTAGVKKEIEIDLNEIMNDGIVFVVWLPDAACVMPHLTIELEKAV